MAPSRELAREEFIADIPVARAQSIIRTAIETTVRASAYGKRYRAVVSFGAPTFPNDEELSQFEPASPSLRGWLAIPAAERRLDLWIRPDEDYYWMSDYLQGALPVEFAAQFIVHFSIVAADRTKVSVIQFRSHVRLGKTFDLTGRAGPGFYWDIRPVAPSPKATTELTEFLARALSAQKQ